MIKKLLFLMFFICLSCVFPKEKPTDASLVSASSGVDCSKYKNTSVGADIFKIDWSGPFKYSKLEGDWWGLFWTWVFAKNEPKFGRWTTEENEPLVVIKDEKFTNDLRNRKSFHQTLVKFVKEHPWRTRKIGDATDNDFFFTGVGSAYDDYESLEWFLGSYQINVKVVEINQYHETKLKVLATNRTNWQSGTRLPPSWICAGLPGFLIPDLPRNNLVPIPGGSFRQRFIWHHTISDVDSLSGDSGNNDNKPNGATQPTVSPPKDNQKYLRWDCTDSLYYGKQVATCASDGNVYNCNERGTIIVRNCHQRGCNRNLRGVDDVCR